MPRVLLLALVAALLGAGLLAGCGGDDDNGGGSDTQTESKQRDTTQTDSTDQGADTETEPEQGEDSPSGSEGQFNEQFEKVNNDLRALGDRVGQTLNTAKGKSNDELAKQFTALGEGTEEIKRRLDELEPPEDLVPLRDRLSKAVEVVAADLGSMGTTADDNDANGFRKAANDLVRHSVDVRNARRALARKTGGTV